MRGKALGLLFAAGLVGSLTLTACGSGGGTATNAGGTTPKGAATSGGGATSALIDKTDGSYVMVKLAYNEQEFGVSGQQCGAGPGPCFDQGGYSLDPTDPVWPKAGEAKVGGIPVWFPDTGGGTKVVKSGINFGPEEGGKDTVPAPPGKYTTMYLLEGGGNGNQPADISFNYTDGSKDQTTLTVDDWCNGSPTGGVLGFTPAGRMDPNGATTTPACGVFLATVPIPGAAKTLKSVDLTLDSSDPGNFEPNVLAMTLKKA